MQEVIGTPFSHGSEEINRHWAIGGREKETAMAEIYNRWCETTDRCIYIYIYTERESEGDENCEKSI